MPTVDRGCTGGGGEGPEFSSDGGKGSGNFLALFSVQPAGFQTMIPQKFTIGQLVDFDTRIEPTPRTKGPYQVLRVLPADDEMKPRVYRIKSQAEPFERNVNEYEIVAVG